jgi:hypothetical protein
MKVRNRISIFILLIFFTSSTCNKIEVRENDAKDIDEATSFAERFYTSVGESEFEKASLLFGGEISTDEGIDYLTQLRTIGDTLTNAVTTGAKTSVRIENGVTQKVYEVYVDVIYSKRETKETITIKNFGDSLRIVGYNVSL